MGELDSLRQRLSLWTASPSTRRWANVSVIVLAGTTLRLAWMLTQATVLSSDGPFNSLLETLHLPTNDWLGNKDTALFTVVGVQIWSTFGLAVTIFLAGLSTLDNEQIEAATLDGANLLQTIRHVIIPSLRPTIQFVVVTTTIGMLTGMFGLLFVMTAGGPFDSTYLPELYIWVKQGKDNRPALASAASMVLFLLMVVIAVVQIKLLSKDVEES